MADINVDIAATALAPGLNANPSTVCRLTPISGVTITQFAVEQWNDGSVESWFSSAAAVEMHGAEASIASTTEPFTSAVLALLPVQITIASTIGAVSSAASAQVGDLPDATTVNIASTAIGPGLGTKPTTVCLLTPTSGITPPGPTVAQWNDSSAVAWFTSAADLELHADANIASTTAALTSAVQARVPIQAAVASTFELFSSTAAAHLDQITSTIEPFSSAVAARTVAISRPELWNAVFFREERVLRIYAGSHLVKGFARGSLFDVDGNPLTIELADGTPVTLELS